MAVRTSILDTSTRLFAQLGFAGVSLKQIADQVGITKPSLLYHFPSKDRLRDEVLGTLLDHWATRLPKLLRVVTSGEGELEALMDELWEFFEEDPDRARLIARELLDRPGPMRARLADSLAPIVTLVAGRMKKAQERGVLRHDVDAEAFVLHVIALTLTSVAASSVVAPVTGDDAVSIRRRQRAELRRMARASLFPDSLPTRPLDTPAHVADLRTQRE